MDILKVIRRNPFVFPAACVATAAMVFLSEGAYWESVSSLDELDKAATARTSILSLTQGIFDAESGQRGYLLTGRKEYLGPYDDAGRQIAESIRTLTLYYGQDPKHTDVLERLRALVDARLAELAKAIRLSDGGDADTATELVLTEVRRGQMEVIRTLGVELLAHESAKVVEARASIYRALMVSRVGVAMLTCISLIGLYIYLRQNFALARHQEALRQVEQIERDRLEVEVSQRTAQLTDLTRHLLTAREDERHRLARDLHDELGALLTSAKLDAARIKVRLGDTAPETQERLAHLVATLNAGIALGRRIIEDLRPSTLSNLGLVAALEILAREFGERSGMQVHFALAPVKLSAPADLVVYRLVQEALTNLSKHAQASQVWITLQQRDGIVEASVRDDGVGFDPATPPASAFGLLGMRYRVEAEQGRLAVMSAPGQGTTVALSLPSAA